MLLGESYQPVASKRVAPISVGDANGGYISISIRIGNACGLALSIVHVGDAPQIGLCHAYQICILGDGLEDEREVHLPACRDGVGLGQRDNSGPFHGVCLPVSR